MGNKSKNRAYSVIIVSDATSSSKEFVVSHKHLRNGIIAAAALAVFFAFVIFHYLTITLDTQKMVRLERDTALKQKRIDELSKTLRNTTVRLKEMESYKDKIMVATGLTSPFALTEVGQGGPAGGQPIDAAAAYATSSGSGPLNDTLANPRDIETQSSKILDSLKQVTGMIDAQKVRLACTPAIWPTHGFMTTVFGNRIHPFTGKWESHSGIDIATQLGNKVIATADGTVLVSEYRDNIGNMILIDHGFGYTTRYGHLASFLVREGQRVKRGQVIGTVGTTGRSTGPHLHYEVRFFDKALNPHKFILD